MGREERPEKKIVVHVNSIEVFTPLFPVGDSGKQRCGRLNSWAAIVARLRLRGKIG